MLWLLSILTLYPIFLLYQRFVRSGSRPINNQPINNDQLFSMARGKARSKRPEKAKNAAAESNPPAQSNQNGTEMAAPGAHVSDNLNGPSEKQQIIATAAVDSGNLGKQNTEVGLAYTDDCGTSSRLPIEIGESSISLDFADLQEDTLTTPVALSKAQRKKQRGRAKKKSKAQSADNKDVNQQIPPDVVGLDVPEAATVEYDGELKGDIKCKGKGKENSEPQPARTLTSESVMRAPGQEILQERPVNNKITPGKGQMATEIEDMQTKATMKMTPESEKPEVKLPETKPKPKVHDVIVAPPRRNKKRKSKPSKIETDSSKDAATSQAIQEKTKEEQLKDIEEQRNKTRAELAMLDAVEAEYNRSELSKSAPVSPVDLSFAEWSAIPVEDRFSRITHKEKIAVQTCETIPAALLESDKKHTSSTTETAMASPTLISMVDRIRFTFSRVSAKARAEAHHGRFNMSTTAVPGDTADDIQHDDVMTSKEVEAFLMGIEEVASAEHPHRIFLRRYWRTVKGLTRDDGVGGVVASCSTEPMHVLPSYQHQVEAGREIEGVLIAEFQVDKDGRSIGQGLWNEAGLYAELVSYAV